MQENAEMSLFFLELKAVNHFAELLVLGGDLALSNVYMFDYIYWSSVETRQSFIRSVFISVNIPIFWSYDPLQG